MRSLVLERNVFKIRWDVAQQHFLPLYAFERCNIVMQGSPVDADALAQWSGCVKCRERVLQGKAKG